MSRHDQPALSEEASPGRVPKGVLREREKRARITAFLAGNPLVVGLDLAKEHHAAWLLGRDLAPIARFMVRHSRVGLAKLLERAEHERHDGGFDRIIVFMETTSYFWMNVANFLEQNQVVYRTVAPLAVAREREIQHLTYAKSDYRDAQLIAQLGAGGKWLQRTLDRDPLWAELRVLAYEHEALLEAENTERNRIRSLLGLVVPEFLEAFASPVGKTARALLRGLAGSSPLPATVAEFRSRISSVTGHRLAKSKIRILLALLDAQPSFGVERLLSPVLVRVGLAVDRFEVLAEQRERVRARLVALYQQTSYRSILDTVPGVSPESHALLLGLIGDPVSYDRSTCLVKLAGTEPRDNASGKATGSHSISRRGRSPLRAVVFRIVFAFGRSNAQFAAYRTRLCERQENPLSWHQAMVATGNKYLRLVYALCKTGRPYDSTKLGGARA